jgi:hypothetical protein
MTIRLTRRRLLHSAALAVGGLAVSPITSSQVFAAGQYYKGRLLVTLQLNGGADVTSFCDPKVNTPGEPAINHWAESYSPEKAGRISFAPFGRNEKLFKKYRKYMLVVNGVDSQTNAHSTGVLYNWSGRNSVGAPSLTALHAAKNSSDQPLAYTGMGGFSQTAGLIRLNRIKDINNIRSLLNPTIDPWSGDDLRPESESNSVKQFIDGSLNRMAPANLSPRQLASIQAYTDARASRGELNRLLDILPAPEEMAPNDFLATPNGSDSDLLRKIQGVLLIFKAGLGSAADIELGEFDSHDNNDAWQEPLLAHAADAIDFFWSYAAELGLANRLTLIVGSDFGRTNFYNDADGKDHWPIGSYIIMEKNPAWGNRVVGATDDLHFAVPIDPATLKRAPNKGINILPAHVHLALRKHLGLHDYANRAGFRLNVESLDIFNPKKNTV